MLCVPYAFVPGDDTHQDPFELNTEDDYDYEQDHKSGFTWRLSTHKDIHRAACNGVLAGLVGITAGGVGDRKSVV